MDQDNFFIYLKKNYPHLYIVEQQVIELRDKAGFGTVFVELEMSKNVVNSYKATMTATGILVNKHENKFDITE